MKYCSNCGKEVMDEAVICINCGCSIGNANPNQSPYQNQFSSPNPNDIPSTGLSLLSFFIPLVGLILYVMNKDTSPKKAKSIGRCALAGFIVGFITITIVITIAIATLVVTLE